MHISNFEKKALNQWVNLHSFARKAIRILTCSLITIIAAVLHLRSTGALPESYQLLLEGQLTEIFCRNPDLLARMLLTFAMAFVLSVLATRIARDRLELEKTNAKKAQLIEQLEIEKQNSAQLIEELKAEKARTEILIEQLRKKTLRDQLTQLHNRHYLDELSSVIDAEARRHSWNTWAIMLDLDKLKAVNDNFGHVAGDAVLSYCAQKLLSLLRETDHCVRLGGDEFLIFGNDPSADAAEQLFQKILSKMDSWSLEIKDLTIKVTASLGYCSKKGSNLMEIIKEADLKMYQQKSAKS